MRTSPRPSSLRRSVAASTLALAAGLLAIAGPSCGSTVVVVECLDDETACGTSCVDLSSNPQNCGACGNVCEDGATCQGGVCSGGSCPPGLAECFGSCVDLLSSWDNCGGCGNICYEGTCVQGVCTAQVCPPGTVDCFGVCTDIGWDPANCGGCGFVCGPQESCVNGVCEFQGCPPGWLQCNGQCVNPQTNPQNCGGCGIACGPNQVCQSGSCVGCQGPVLCGLCNFQDVGLPQSVSGNTSGAGDYYSPGCVPPGSGENAFLITAAAGGLYTFDTFGSSYDTALSVVNVGTCQELVCNDDTMNVQSQVQVNLAPGQQVLVVVDGYAGQTGPYTMHVTAPIVPACGDGDLGSLVPQTITGSTAGAGNDFQPTCGAQGGNDRAYTFTAPFSGNFTFNTFGTSWDTVLHLLNGCGGAAIACNDDTMGLQSQVTVSLSAGQQVVVVVDGFGAQSQGNFTLNIN